MCGRTFKKRRLPCGYCEVKPLACDHILCPDCAAERAKPLQKRILARCSASGKALQFLTLTVPNVPELTRELVSKLVKDFARLRRTEVFTCKGKEQDFGSAILGGVFSIESTFDLKTRSWHPHIHVLIEGPQRFTRARLMALKSQWERITGNAKYLRLQPVYRVSRSGKKIFGKADRKALRELVKYVTKVADFATEPALVDEFLTAFKGVRRVQAFGSFLGVFKKEEREVGDETGRFECERCGGTHLYSECVDEGVASLSEVEQLPDGTWQLRFDFVREMRQSVPESPPPWELTPVEPVRADQKRLGFAGAMPAESEPYPSLFEGVA